MQGITVGSHLDFVKAAVIFAAAVVLAVVYGTFDRFVGKFGSHDIIPSFPKKCPAA